MRLTVFLCATFYCCLLSVRDTGGNPELSPFPFLESVASLLGALGAIEADANAENLVSNGPPQGAPREVVEAIRSPGAGRSSGSGEGLDIGEDGLGSLPTGEGAGKDLTGALSPSLRRRTLKLVESLQRRLQHFLDRVDSSSFSREDGVAGRSSGKSRGRDGTSVAKGFHVSQIQRSSSLMDDSDDEQHGGQGAGGGDGGGFSSDESDNRAPSRRGRGRAELPMAKRAKKGKDAAENKDWSERDGGASGQPQPTSPQVHIHLTNLDACSFRLSENLWLSSFRTLSKNPPIFLRMQRCL